MGMLRVYLHNHAGRVGRAWGWIARQPSWIKRVAIVGVLLFVVLPLAMLALVAVLMGAAIFLGLALVATVLGTPLRVFRNTRSWMAPHPWHRHGWSDFADDGRRNVRVIVREP